MASTPSQLAHWLLKDFNKAVRDFDMIAEGDRIAVALSGGKDSFSLLKLLDIRRKASPENYDLAIIHIIGDARGTECPHHLPLLEWIETSGYEYSVEPIHLPEDEPLPLNCQRCTWNRRRTLFEAADKLGCNVIAFGHHADDLAQTTLLNLFWQGKVETMTPRRDYFDGKFQIIRPMCYLSEKDIRRFARACEFPPPPPICPQSDHSRRKMVANLIRETEQWSKNVRVNLLRAGLHGNQIWEQDEK